MVAVRWDGIMGLFGDYLAAAVTGNNRAGGLVGTSGGTVTNCYSYGSVSSTSSPRRSDGL
ncbi:MAG: hypothetical protein QM751_01940 [Paludibacteraceae bacterium]